MGFSSRGGSRTVAGPVGREPSVVFFDLDDTIFDHSLTCRAAP